MSKKINTEPINVRNLVTKVRFLYKAYGLKTFLFAVVFLLFLICKNFSHRIFSNDYVLNSILNNSTYSRKCFYLHENDPKLIDKLKSFYLSKESRNVTSNVIFTNIPKLFSSDISIENRKFIYMHILMPILLKVQKEIIDERERLIDISFNMIRDPIVQEDFDFIVSLANKYKVDLLGDVFWHYSSAVDELISKVDIIPTSLSLAIAIIETGWGTSRFLQEGNSLFAEWAWNDDRGLIPLLRDEQATHVVRKFDSLEDSVRSFYLNLNVHPEYHRFREARRAAREEVEGLRGTLDSTKLSSKLNKYSTTVGYTTLLNDIIYSNSLQDFDNYTYVQSNREICVTFR